MSYEMGKLPYMHRNCGSANCHRSTLATWKVSVYLVLAVTEGSVLHVANP